MISIHFFETMRIPFAVIGFVVATATSENDVVKLMQDMMDVHPLWLRERCTTTDGSTNNRNNNNHHLKVSSVKIDKSRDGFVTGFSDGHECFYSKDFMVQELGDDKAFESTKEWGTPDLFLWDKNLISPASYERDDIIDLSDNTRKFLSNLLSTGIAAIENVPTQDGECARLGQTFTSLRETESGRVFNVTQSNDTARSFCVSVHVEHAYKSDAPPDFQMINTLDECKGSDCQSHHSFVDGFAVAKALCEKDRSSFDILATTSLRWESPARVEDGSIFYRYAPILEVGEKDLSSHHCPVVKAVNFNSKWNGLAPKMPNAEMELFYNAKHLISELIRNGDFAIEVQPSLGTTLIFNNRRILHSYSPGTRDEQLWLQGCYLNRDGFAHLYEKLRRQYATLTETPFHSLKSAVKADFDRMGVEYDEAVVKKTKDKLIGILEGLKDSYLGQPVSLYEHNVQTASRALRGGEDDETVFISLFHDVFETLAVKNHGEVIDAMLSPWISPENHWMLA